MATNDDAGLGRDPYWIYLVPEDGLITVAVTGTGDFSYTGTSTYTGSYRFSYGKPKPVVFGTVSDQNTGAPLAPEAYAYVNLMRCEPGYDICRSWAAQTPVATDGSFYFGLLEQPAGSYQLQATGSGYGDYFGTPFELDPTVNTKKNIKMQPSPVLLDGFVACETLLPGETCNIDYQVSNFTDEALELDVWSSVTAYPTGQDVNTVQYSSGKDGAHNPKRITVAAGETLAVTQPLLFPASTDLGAGGDIVFFASVSGQPDEVLARSPSLIYQVGQGISTGGGGVIILSSPERARSLGAKPLSAAAISPNYTETPLHVVTGTVTMKDSGLPPAPETEPLVYLFQCNHAGDELCSQYLGFLPVDEDGRYVVRWTGEFGGRYQMWSDALGSAQAYSDPFDIASGGGGYTDVNLKLRAPLAPVSNLEACGGNTSVPKGSPCIARYTVTNTDDETRTYDVWAQILSTTTGGTINTVNYDLGQDGKRKAFQLTLEPGQTVTVEQEITWPELAQSGTYATASFYTSFAGQPHRVTGYLYGFTVFVTPEGAQRVERSAAR